MPVVQHEGVRINTHLECLRALAQFFEEAQTVRILPEDRPPLISAGHYMVDSAFKLQS